MLISVPIFFPLIGTLALDPVWFGIFVLLVLEMSGTTPPFGLLLHIMMGVAPQRRYPVSGRESGVSVLGVRRDPDRSVDRLPRDCALFAEFDELVQAQ